MNRNFKLLGVALLSLSLQFCTSDDNDRDDITPPTPEVEKGFFVLNEGNIGVNNASLTYLNENFEPSHFFYKSLTSNDLGDTGQSLAKNDDNVYIVLNHSNNIEVLHFDDDAEGDTPHINFTHEASITENILNPRYIAFENNKGYVTNWGDPTNPDDDYVAVIDLNTHAVLSTISVVEGPETILSEDGKIFVAHQGGYGYGNTISVIDTDTDTVVGTIAVGDVPSAMVEENDKLYVLCSGKAAWTGDETMAGLYKINVDTYEVEAQKDFAEGEHPRFLEEENNKLYYTLNGSVYETIQTDFATATPIIDFATDGVMSIYGFALEEEQIFITDAKDYISLGELFIYNLDGSLKQTVETQLLPNSVLDLD